MCWIAYQNELGAQNDDLIAKDDITAFKIVKRNGNFIVPYFYDNVIIYGKLENGNISVIKDSIKSDMIVTLSKSYNENVTKYAKCDKALHFYSSRSILECTDFGYFFNPMVCIDSCSVTYDTEEYETYLMKCTIPKGSRFRINNAREIISDTLLVDGIKLLTGKISNFIGSGKMTISNLYEKI